MTAFYQRALQTLGLRQGAYHITFGVGTPGHNALVDLALYSNAFAADPEKVDHDTLMTMHGRRQAFFRIFKHVKLSPAELEAVARSALLNAAARLQNGAEE